MHIDHPAAFLAAPSLVVISKKTVNTELFYGLQVLDHAHPVLCAVSLVQSPKALAREILAFEAETGAVGLGSRTIPDNAVEDGDRLAIVASAAARAVLVLPQVPAANPAVHATRSDLFAVQFSPCYPSPESELFYP